jgi:hypothetical protein
VLFFLCFSRLLLLLLLLLLLCGCVFGMVMERCE